MRGGRAEHGAPYLPILVRECAGLRLVLGSTSLETQLLSCGQLFGISDMKRLIRKIVVCPGAPDEFIEQLRNACIESKRRWLSDRIERSYSERSWDSFTT